MNPIYRIRDWTVHFENNRTKEMVHMRWVPVPNKHDGEGFQRIMREPDGMVIYGCWHLILQVASKCLRCRGTLLRDDGTPYTADSLSLKTGWRNVADFKRALEFLSSPDVAWIEVVTQEGAGIPQEGAGIPQEPARNGREWNGREWKGREDIKPEPNAGAGAGFDDSVRVEYLDKYEKIRSIPQADLAQWAVNFCGDKLDWVRVYKSYISVIGPEAFRSILEQFVGEVYSGEDCRNRGAALVARVKRAVDDKRKGGTK
jgi:hypothetical protein